MADNDENGTSFYPSELALRNMPPPEECKCSKNKQEDVRRKAAVQ